jgi:TolA-binding protein
VSADRSQLRALGERLAQEQDDLLARQRLPSTLRLEPRRAPRRALWILAAAVALSAAGAGALVLRPRALDVTIADKPGLPGSWVAAPSDAQVPIRFSDGTDVKLASGSQARILDITGRGAHLMLESGAATLSVKPRPRAQWTVSAGPYTVEVRGTRFEIGWSPQDELLTLTLTEGKIAVSGCALGDSRPMFAGETLRASCRDKDFRITRTPPPEAAETLSAPPPGAASASAGPVGAPAALAPAPGESPSPHAASTRPGAAPSGAWQALARASKFKEAFDLAREAGFDNELDRAAVPDLLLLGDAARLSGSATHALRAYQKVRARAPGTPWAANAAFAMGRVYFDQMDAFAEAARWFATYSSEQHDGPLAREALGREMEARARAGDRAEAARAAGQYLRRYPNGPHAPLARTLE